MISHPQPPPSAARSGASPWLRQADNIFPPCHRPFCDRMNFRLNSVDLAYRSMGLSEVGDAPANFRGRLYSRMAVG